MVPAEDACHLSNPLKTSSLGAVLSVPTLLCPDTFCVSPRLHLKLGKGQVPGRPDFQGRGLNGPAASPWLAFVSISLVHPACQLSFQDVHEFSGREALLCEGCMTWPRER